MEKGYLALVLHSHLPYVRHPEYDQFLEEDWLFEAITETYIPLINVFDGLVNDGVDFRITMSLTPTLIAMLTDPQLQHRYVRHLNKLAELSEKEIERTKHQPEFNALAHLYRDIFLNARICVRRKIRPEHRHRLQEVPGPRQGGDHHLRRDPRLPAAHAEQERDSRADHGRR